MIKYIVLNDCYCQGYLYELMNYPREGLKEKKLKKGDIVEFVNEWQNFYGTYFRCKKDGITYDLLKEDVELYSENRN